MRRFLLGMLFVILTAPSCAQFGDGGRRMRYIELYPTTQPTLNSTSVFVWSSGDTLMVSQNGTVYKIVLFGADDQQVLGFQAATSTWEPVTMTGGDSGAIRLNDILGPDGITGIALGAHYFQMTATDQTAPGLPIWWLADGSSGQSGSALRVNTNAGSLRRVVEFFAGGTSNGVFVSSTGVLMNSGTGYIDADRYNGNAVIAKADLATTIAFEDEANTFTLPQTLTGTGATGQLIVTNTNVGSTAYGLAVSSVGGHAIFANSTNNYGVFARSTNGVGGGFWSVNGSMLTLHYGSLGTTRLTFNTGAIEPAAGMDLGTETVPFDSLFVNYINIATEHAGKGEFAANDTLLVYGLTGVDSNSVGFANLVDKDAILTSLFVKTYNDGHIEITSSAGSMEGVRVQWYVRKSTQ